VEIIRARRGAAIGHIAWGVRDTEAVALIWIDGAPAESTAEIRSVPVADSGRLVEQASLWLSAAGFSNFEALPADRLARQLADLTDDQGDRPRDRAALRH
jgi:hypothetical protein